MKNQSVKILSPVSKKYVIKYDANKSWAYVDIRNITESKMFFNSIINIIIIHYQNFPNTILKGITFEYSNEQIELYKILCRQMDLFNINFDNKLNDSDIFKFDNNWKTSIEKGFNVDICQWENILKNYKNILFYKTVTDSNVQIRYFGYQIAKFNPFKNSELNNLVLVNNKQNYDNFDTHYINLSNNRTMDNNSEKLEHYLESMLLQRIQDGVLSIFNTKIEKLFISRLNFQFPTLLKTGEKMRTGNSPKYVDIFAKNGNKPVIMELKVHHNTNNSRGEYVFEAFGQLINYFIYLLSIFNDPKMSWGKQLNNVKNLDWQNPILFIIVDELGDDNTAIRFREYISNLKTYFLKPSLIRFVEVSRNFKNKFDFTNEI